MSKLRDELLCVFASVFLWEVTQKCLKSSVKCYCVVRCVLVLASPYHDVPNLCKLS